MLLAALSGLVTVSFDALPLPQALERLSAATGERLDCVPALRSEVLVVRLKEADRERALREIATLYDAGWERRESGLTLVIDRAAVRRREAVERSKAVAKLRGSVEYLKARLAEQPAVYTRDTAAAYRRHKADEGARQRQALETKDYGNAFTLSSADEETPAWRAAARIIPLLSQSELLALPPESRTVYVEHPTPMQRGFPAAAEPALRQYREELEAFDPNLAVARLRLVVKAWENVPGAYNMTLVAVSANGKALDTADLRMNDDTARLKHKDGTFDAPKTLPGERPLEVPPEVREYRTVMKTSFGAADPERQALLPKWRAILADPVANEPTRWLPAGELRAAAEALYENLVGAPDEYPDGTFEVKYTATETARQFVERTQGCTVKDGWLILNPGRRGRGPRDRAKALLQECVRLGGVPLDDAAEWAGASPETYPFVTWIGEALDTILTREGSYSAVAALLDPHALRLWDALGPAVRTSLRSGGVIDLAALPPEAQDWTIREAYWYDLVPGESTETLPNGIVGGTVSLSYAETPIAVALSSKDPSGEASMALSPEQLGLFLVKGDTYRKVKPEVYQAYDRYRVGVAKAYTLHFKLGRERVPMNVELDENFLDPRGPLLDTLPEGFGKRVEAARAKAAVTPDPPLDVPAPSDER